MKLHNQKQLNFLLLYNQSHDPQDCDHPHPQAPCPIDQIGREIIVHFRVSRAREERPDSDVDILVEFTGRATFDRYMDTKFYLEDLLGCRVDLVTPKAIKPRMKPYIMQDLVHVA